MERSCHYGPAYLDEHVLQHSWTATEHTAKWQGLFQIAFLTSEECAFAHGGIFFDRPKNRVETSVFGRRAEHATISSICRIQQSQQRLLSANDASLVTVVTKRSISIFEAGERSDDVIFLSFAKKHQQILLLKMIIIYYAENSKKWKVLSALLFSGWTL